MVKLDTLIAEEGPRVWAQERVLGARAYVREKGFTQLYVRLTWRYIENTKTPCLDLANIEARQPSKGAFKALVARLRVAYPHLTLFVECVQTDRFAAGLQRMGFKPQAYGDVCHAPDCFYLKGSV